MTCTECPHVIWDYEEYSVVSPYQTNNYAMLMESEVLQIIDKYMAAESEE